MIVQYYHGLEKVLSHREQKATLLCLIYLVLYITMQKIILYWWSFDHWSFDQTFIWFNIHLSGCSKNNMIIDQTFITCINKHIYRIIFQHTLTFSVEHKIKFFKTPKYGPNKVRIRKRYKPQHELEKVVGSFTPNIS